MKKLMQAVVIAELYALEEKLVKEQAVKPVDFPTYQERKQYRMAKAEELSFNLN